ncbi:MAG: hypothetical protein EXR71_03060 [Myxococcales bacterium]|nr:hypothetical protein [Myxococcales bacterium]
MRFFTPVVFLVAAAGVWWFNNANDLSKLYFPFELVSAPLTGDYQTQGTYTVVTFVVLAVITGARALARQPEP